MCNKVKNRIECDDCGYSLSEARYPDDYDSHSLSCNSNQEEIDKHISFVNGLEADLKQHPWDCLCLLHR